MVVSQVASPGVPVEVAGDPTTCASRAASPGEHSWSSAGSRGPLPAVRHGDQQCVSCPWWSPHGRGLEPVAHRATSVIAGETLVPGARVWTAVVTVMVESSLESKGASPTGQQPCSVNWNAHAASHCSQEDSQAPGPASEVRPRAIRTDKPRASVGCKHGARRAHPTSRERLSDGVD